MTGFRAHRIATHTTLGDTRWRIGPGFLNRKLRRPPVPSSKQVLMEFLNRELDLGFTFASSGSRETALPAVLAVERLVGQVEDRVEQRKIEERLVDLKGMIGEAVIVTERWYFYQFASTHDRDHNITGRSVDSKSRRTSTRRSLFPSIGERRIRWESVLLRCRHATILERSSDLSQVLKRS